MTNDQDTVITNEENETLPSILSEPLVINIDSVVTSPLDESIRSVSADATILSAPLTPADEATPPPVAAEVPGTESQVAEVVTPLPSAEPEPTPEVDVVGESVLALSPIFKGYEIHIPKQGRDCEAGLLDTAELVFEVDMNQPNARGRGEFRADAFQAQLDEKGIDAVARFDKRAGRIVLQIQGGDTMYTPEEMSEKLAQAAQVIGLDQPQALAAKFMEKAGEPEHLQTKPYLPLTFTERVSDRLQSFADGVGNAAERLENAVGQAGKAIESHIDERVVGPWKDAPVTSVASTAGLMFAAGLAGGPIGLAAMGAFCLAGGTSLANDSVTTPVKEFLADNMVTRFAGRLLGFGPESGRDTHERLRDDATGQYFEDLQSQAVETPAPSQSVETERSTGAEVPTEEFSLDLAETVIDLDLPEELEVVAGLAVALSTSAEPPAVETPPEQQTGKSSASKPKIPSVGR